MRSAPTSAQRRTSKSASLPARWLACSVAISASALGCEDVGSIQSAVTAPQGGSDTGGMSNGAGGASGAANGGATSVSQGGQSAPNGGTSLGGASVAGSSAGGARGGATGSGGSTTQPDDPNSIRVLDYQGSGSKVTGTNGLSCADDSGANPGTICALSPGSTLTAAPAMGYGVKWGGACASATGNSCTLSGSGPVTVSFDPSGSNIWWVSKSGKDSNDGHSIGTAFATFHKALRAMAAGDTLYIDDGVYTDTIGAYDGNFSAWGSEQGRDGLSATQRTKILGYRRHAVTVDGGGKLYPLSIYRGQHIELGNIVFLHSPLSGGSSYAPVHIEQSLDIYLHQIGAAYPDPKCDNCMAIVAETSSNVVVEESWAWGFGARYGILFHGGLQNVARRNVVRYDGSVNGNPKAGVALYSEDESIAENNITLDFDAGPDDLDDVHAAFFATSSVSLKPPSFPPGCPTGLKTVSFYGNVAVNTMYTTEAIFFFDSLTSVGGTLTVVDNVAGNGMNMSPKDNGRGFWLSGDDGTPHTNVVFSHNTTYNVKGEGVRIDDLPRWKAITFNDNLISNLNPSSEKCFVDSSDSGARISASSNQLFGCAAQKVANDAKVSTANPALAYFLRLEAGSPAKGTGTSNSDRGATVVKRYVDGKLTDGDLWPFPNEDVIKQDLCAGPDGTQLNSAAINTRGHNATGFCASGKSLTKYVWEQLGNTSPY